MSLTVTSITAVVQIDSRNPFDKLVIRTLGASSSPATLKLNVSLDQNEVLHQFQQIRQTKLLTLSVLGEDTDEIHKLNILRGKTVSEINLLAKQSEVVADANFNFGPMDLGFKIGRLYRMSKVDNFADLTLSNVKLLSLNSEFEQRTNRPVYHANFKILGNLIVGSY